MRYVRGLGECLEVLIPCRIEGWGAEEKVQVVCHHGAAIEEGADFAQVAKDNSSCPSSRDGGNLGSFGPGQMVREFDEVVFSAQG